MASPDPFFTVIVGTYNRGAHILATLQSVMKQRFDDFEVLVIGDACTDQTGTIVDALGDPRMRWMNLEQRTGTQSGPNNHGLAQARGQVIAYLGHDDVWEPDHLANHAAIYAQSAPDAVASGIVLHEGERGGVDRVLGFPDQTDGGTVDFIPPSALTHTRAIAEKTAGWPLENTAEMPVDSEFQQDLLAQGTRIMATNSVSVHKFVAATRYLSYLVPSSFEQTRMLRLMRHEDHQDWLKKKVARAKSHGRFMDGQHAVDVSKGAGAKDWSDHTRGLILPDLQSLGDKTITIAQDGAPRGFDWRPLTKLAKSSTGIRWTGPNNRPKLLIPVAASDPVKLDIALRCTAELPPEDIEFLLNGKNVYPKFKAMKTAYEDGATHQLLLRCDLRGGAPSVMEMIYSKDAMEKSGANLWLGVGVGRMRITKANKAN
jgi:glycosyltransferase involved in cell wall biosynthesis